MGMAVNNRHSAESSVNNQVIHSGVRELVTVLLTEYKGASDAVAISPRIEQFELVVNEGMDSADASFDSLDPDGLVVIVNIAPFKVQRLNSA